MHDNVKSFMDWPEKDAEYCNKEANHSHGQLVNVVKLENDG